MSDKFQVQDAYYTDVQLSPWLFDSGLNAFQIALYAHLSWRAKQSEECFESVANMGMAIGISESKARRVLQELVAMRMIQREDRTSKGQTAVYRRLPEHMWVLPRGGVPETGGTRKPRPNRHSEGGGVPGTPEYINTSIPLKKRDVVGVGKGSHQPRAHAREKLRSFVDLWNRRKHKNWSAIRSLTAFEKPLLKLMRDCAANRDADDKPAPLDALKVLDYAISVALGEKWWSEKTGITLENLLTNDKPLKWFTSGALEKQEQQKVAQSPAARRQQMEAERERQREETRKLSEMPYE